MKATFLIPPCRDHRQSAERSAGCTRVVYPMPNIYELTAAAVVREVPGVETVSYRDFTAEKKPMEAFRSFLDTDRSDVYLIWTVNLSIESDLPAIADIDEARPGVPVILLGPGPTYFTSRCLVSENVIIVRGEPEATLAELIGRMTKGDMRPSYVMGTSVLREGKVINNPTRPLIEDLDALPFAARDLVADHEFHNPKLKTTPYATMFTSRNCPYRCIYCVPSSMTFAREIEHRRSGAPGRKPRIGFRSIGSVEKEVSMLHNQGVRAIGFMDDNFIWDEKRTEGICGIMRRYNIVWGCQARADAITEPIARMLGESGCRYVDIGVESFNDDILKYVHKGITREDIFRAVNLLKKYGVPVKLNILIGCSPLETTATVKQTLHEAKKLDVDQVMFNIVSPFPGTEYYDLCLKNGWIEGGEYRPTDVQRQSILNLPSLSSRQMERLLRSNNMKYFLSPRFIIKQMRRYSSWNEFAHSLRALKTKLFG